MVIAKKLVRVGANGTLVIQGNTNGLCLKIKIYSTPYEIGIHYMAHRMNLAFGVVSSMLN